MKPLKNNFPNQNYYKQVALFDNDDSFLKIGNSRVSEKLFPRNIGRNSLKSHHILQYGSKL